MTVMMMVMVTLERIITMMVMRMMTMMTMTMKMYLCSCFRRETRAMVSELRHTGTLRRSHRCVFARLDFS